MKFIKPSYEIVSCPDGEEALRILEKAARVCYKSEDDISDGRERCKECSGTGSVMYQKDVPCGFSMAQEMAIKTCNTCNGKGWNQVREPSSHTMIRKIMKRGHHSVIEHASVTIRFICNRGVSHEGVRHRLASYSQESTRYCNYSKGKFDGEINFIDDSKFLTEEQQIIGRECLKVVEDTYMKLIASGLKPQFARNYLPIGLKTEYLFSCNFREIRHIFQLRTDITAHPQMRELMIPLLEEMKSRIPIIFDDIEIAPKARV